MNLKMQADISVCICIYVLTNTGTYGPAGSLMRVWNCVFIVPFKVAQHQLDTLPETVSTGQTDIECWKLGGCQLIQHGNAIPLHAEFLANSMYNIV